MRRVVTSILILICSFRNIHSEPIIIDVTGTLIEGGTVLVAGTGFGSQGPTIRLYDDFEDGIQGEIVDQNAVIGNWWGYGTDKPTFDNIGFSGNLSMRIHDGSGKDGFLIIKANFPPATEMFVSYWFQIPEGFTFPGTDIPGKIPTRSTLPDGSNASTWKLAWIFDGDNATNDNDIALPTHVNGDLAVGGNNTRQVGDGIRLTFPGPGNFEQDDSRFRFGEWARIMVWLKANETDPLLPGKSMFSFAIPTSNINAKQSSDTDPVFTTGPPYGPKPPYQWTHLNFTGWSGNGVEDSGWSLTRPLFDDVYLATGAGAQARIEICDAALYTDCTKFGYITTDNSTDWMDTNIIGVVRKGALAESELGSAFLYVFDANGEVNANGYPICGKCPLSPTNLEVE